MLDTINNISREKSKRLICLGSQVENNIYLPQYQQDLAKMKAKIVDVDADTWLLFSENTYYFLLGLMTLSGLDKKVVICASAKPDWIETFSNKFDAVLSDGEIQIADKPAINFTLPAGPVESWHPSYSGREMLMFFTSGSTGLPKSIDKPLIALLNEIATLEMSFGEKLQGSVSLASVSHLHIYGLLFKVLLPFLTGGSWVNQQVEYPEQLSQLVKGIEKAVFISSPAFLSRLDLNLSTITMEEVFSSGGPLSFPAAQAAASYFGCLPIEIYGSTETGGIAFRQQQYATTTWTPFIGMTFENVSAGTKLFSPHVPDVPGILLDDILELADDGSFMLKGRKDRVLKIEEKRVSLTEIEKYLEEFDTVQQSIALIITGTRDIIGCVVVLSEMGKQIQMEKGFSYLVKQWKNRMRDRFELVTIPKKWRALDEIPLNSQSKVDVELLLTNFKVQ